MNELFNKIKRHAEERVLRDSGVKENFLLYLDRKVMVKGEVLDIITAKIEFDEPTLVVFVDKEPNKNFGHRCHYLLYNSETGDLIREISAKFPYFIQKQPETLELFRTGGSNKSYKRKKY